MFYSCSLYMILKDNQHHTLGLHLLRANGEAPLHTLVTNVSNIPNGIGVKTSLMGLKKGYSVIILTEKNELS